MVAFLWLGWALAVSAEVSAQDALTTAATRTVLILPLESKSGASADLCDQLTAAITVQVARISGVNAVSFREVESTMTQEQLRQVAGCTAASCAADIAGALNTDDIVVGTLGKVSSGYFLTMSLVRAKDAHIIGRISQRYAGAEEGVMFDDVPRVVRDLFTPEKAVAAEELTAPVTTEPIRTATEAPNAPVVTEEPKLERAPPVTTGDRAARLRTVLQYSGSGGLIAAVAALALTALLWAFVGVVTLVDIAGGNWSNPLHRQHGISWQVAIVTDGAVILGLVLLALGTPVGVASLVAVVAALVWPS